MHLGASRRLFLLSVHLLRFSAFRIQNIEAQPQTFASTEETFPTCYGQLFARGLWPKLLLCPEPPSRPLMSLPHREQ